MIDTALTHPPIGLSAFDSLRAEDEPWLAGCYVEPDLFDLIAGARSFLVFGEPGSGKTALFRMLRDRLAQPARPGAPLSGLVVDWKPIPPQTSLSGSPAAELLFSQVLRCCADQLLSHLVAWPDQFLKAPPDVQGTLAWFIRRYLDVPAELRLAERPAAVPNADGSALHTILEQAPSDHWLASQQPALMINEIVKNLRQVGLATVYILLSSDALDDSESMQQGLSDLLSSTSLFENSSFLYKMILPASLRNPLGKAGAALRQRVVVYTLGWTTEALTQIVLRRTALAAGRPLGGLQEVCPNPKLVSWLERTGGSSPRGWLECITPLAARYLQTGQAVSTEEWRAIRSQSPPILSFNEDDNSVTIGWRRIDDLPDVPRALLRFLWEHRDRVCTRRELYFRAYLSTSYADTPIDQVRDFQVDFEHVLDTAVNRLREKIEPDPRQPIYITTVRGKGYRLEHWW
ncbi:MAG: winged helix-turn-helix domain-containing protein [Anaerolineae bacterium]|nr:winged helix-turn-helix domain-containing protein [Anaerolineae bacterium]